MKKILTLLIISIFYFGCNQGITPSAVGEELGFGGKINFIGSWADSITRTHVVAFESPLLSSNDFNILNIKYVSEEIPFGSTEYNFKTTLNAALQPIQPGNISYIVIVQSSQIDLSLERSAWFVVGVYTVSGDQSQPSTIILQENTFINNVNILCDFNNPPPQPPN